MNAHKLNSRLVIVPILGTMFVICSCSSELATMSSAKQNIDLVVSGIYAEPDGAEGDAAPVFYEMTWKSLSLGRSGEDPVVFEPDTEEAIRIVDRSQIIFSDDIKDYEEATFTNVAVTFSNDVVVGGKYRSDYDLSLDTAEVGDSSPVTIKKGEGLEVTVKIKWQNTIVRDVEAKEETVLQPELTVEMK